VRSNAPVKRILIVGEDESLLRSRADALDKLDAQIVTSGSGNLDFDFGGAPFDIVVLCHSMHLQSVLAVSIGLQKRWPDVDIIQLVRRGKATYINLPDDEIIRVESDPNVLLRHVTKLLSAS
jgi:hypothetical protein